MRPDFVEQTVEVTTHPDGWVCLGARAGREDMYGRAPLNAILANVTDLNGLRIELAELTPDSLQKKAIDSWK